MKKIFALILVVTIIMAMGITAYAADPSTNVPPEEIDVEEYTHYEAGGIAVNSSDWTEIAYSTTGFNCNVQVNTFNTQISYVSIMMYDANGNYVWGETNCIPYNKTRVFYCGPNVYIIKAKCVSGGSTVSTWNTTREPGIYNN